MSPLAQWLLVVIAAIQAAGTWYRARVADRAEKRAAREKGMKG